MFLYIYEIKHGCLNRTVKVKIVNNGYTSVNNKYD